MQSVDEESCVFALYVPIGHWVEFKILEVHRFEPHDGGDFLLNLLYYILSFQFRDPFIYFLFVSGIIDQTRKIFPYKSDWILSVESIKSIMFLHPIQILIMRIWMNVY